MGARQAVIEEARGADEIIALSPHSVMSHFLIKDRHPVPATARKQDVLQLDRELNPKMANLLQNLPPFDFIKHRILPTLLIILSEAI